MDTAHGRTAVVLDQYPLWLEAVDQVLAKIGIGVVAKATNPEDALASVEKHRPDVFLTEISMPSGMMDGLACVRRALQRLPTLKVVVLSMHDDRAYIDAALRAGVVAYVVKTAHPDDVASAIRQAFEHSIYFPGTVTPPIVHTEFAEDESVMLTRREREILQLVAEGYANAQVAKMLWVTEQTVKFHLSNIYRKLGVSNRTEASRWAQINGVLASSPTAISVA